MDLELNRLFHQGDFNGVLAKTVNNLPARLPLECMDLIVGALVFTGQLDHAKAIFSENKGFLDADLSVASTFFIAIGDNRAGAYGDSKNGFLSNLLTLKRHRSSLRVKGLFYIHQGLGFYYLYQCRYALALSHARKAQDAAFGGSFQFGRILAGDLLGNIYAKLCEFSEAKKAFRESRNIAANLENTGIAAAIDINALATEAMAGRGGQKLFTQLNSQFESYAESNNFSKATIGLGLIRQFHIRGDMKRAADVIDAIEDFIVTHKNKRQMAQLCFLQSYHSFLKGRTDKAAKQLDGAISVLNWQHDHSLCLQYFGLKASLLERMGKFLSPDELKAVGFHQRKSQDGLDFRITSRRFISTHDGLDTNNSRYTSGEDPIGDLLDGIQAFGPSSGNVQELLEQGYLGLLRHAFRIAPGSQLVLLDILPATHVIFDRGHVHLCKAPLMQSCRLLLELLSAGAQPTVEIVRHLWGLRYNPERHNSSFYSMISRLRSFLGPFRDWLVVEGGLYSLKAGVRIQTHRSSLVAMPVVELDSTKGTGFKRVQSTLNIRQLRLIENLTDEQIITNKQVQGLYNVSYATATRDLRELVERGILARYGRGKATCYKKNAQSQTATLEIL